MTTDIPEKSCNPVHQRIAAFFLVTMLHIQHDPKQAIAREVMGFTAHHVGVASKPDSSHSRSKNPGTAAMKCSDSEAPSE